MKQLAKETYQLIKINFKNLLVFEVIYRLITGPIFLQLMNYGLRFSLKRAGYSYLTLGNVWFFLLKPWTVVVVVCLAIIGLLLMMIEIGGLITAYSSAAYSLRLKPIDIFLGGIQNLADEVKRNNIKLIGIMLIEVILMNAYFIYRILTHVKPLNFVIKTMLAEPWARSLVLVGIIVFIVIAIPSAFAIHGCMIEQKSFADSMNRSRELLKGRRIKTVCRVVLGQILVIGAFVLVRLLCVIFVAVLVVLFVDKELELAFLMEVCNRIEWVLLFIVSITSEIIYFATVTVQYYQYNNRMHHEERWDFNYSSTRLPRKKSLLFGVAAITIASGLCLFDTAYNGNVITKAMMVETEITAHRGSSRSAPENTMAAVMAAVDEMADRVEIDVQETADGQVVLCHDSSLKRVAGVSKKVSDLTYEELLELDVGSWFSSNYKGEQIPSLEQVMEYAKGKIDLNIEIKNQGNNSPLPEKVLELVNQYEMQEQCVITATNLNYLKAIKEMQPGIKTGYILSAAYGDYYSNEAIDFVSIRSNFVTDNLIERSHENGKTVHAWTVNNKDEIERLKVLGVDNIITDYPVLVREIIYREEATENLLEYLRLLLR